MALAAGYHTLWRQLAIRTGGPVDANLGGKRVGVWVAGGRAWHSLERERTAPVCRRFGRDGGAVDCELRGSQASAPHPRQ